MKRLYKLFLLILFASSCSHQPITIGISKASGSESYKYYVDYIKKIDSDAEIIDFWAIGIDSSMKCIDMCDGILLSGGVDIHPKYFGKPADTLLCEIDPLRDSLEFLLLKRTIDLGIPILAVCRGEQVLNVFEGGSLIINIPRDKPSEIKHKCVDKNSCFHKINILDNTILSNIVKSKEGIVNSNHHQAVDRISSLFAVSAISDDGIIEAYEWAQPADKPFLLAVQWHPERLPEDNSFGLPIGKLFIKKAYIYSKNKNK